MKNFPLFSFFGGKRRKRVEDEKNRKRKKGAKKGFFKPFCEAKAFTENASLKEKLGGDKMKKVKAICIMGFVALIAAMMVMPATAFEPSECDIFVHINCFNPQNSDKIHFRF